MKYWFIRMYYRMKGVLKYDRCLKSSSYNEGCEMWWCRNVSTKTIDSYIYLGSGYYVIKSNRYENK